MKSLATVDEEAAATLMEQLRGAGIAFEARVATEEGGVTVTELLVEDSVYEAACDVVDAWQDEAARACGMVCPRCHSPHLERAAHESVQVAFRCQDCGSTFAAQV